MIKDDWVGLKHVPLVGLNKLSFTIPMAQEYMHLAFSAGLLSSAVKTLDEGRVLWLIAPWDCYGDEFLSLVHHRVNDIPSHWFRINIYEFESFEVFKVSVNGVAGFCLNDLVSHLKDCEHPVLVLDNVCFERSVSGRSFLEEVIFLSEVLRSACPALRLIIRSRALHQTPPMAFEYIMPMDEVDTNTYILRHPKQRNVSERSMAAGEIFRLSSGYQSVVDHILHKLSYTRLSDIAVQSSEMAIHDTSLQRVSPELIFQIELLASTSTKLHSLLSVFSVFPYGEDINNIRNICTGNPFYPTESSRLVNKGMLNTLEYSYFASENVDLPSVVVASSSVVDYFRATFPEVFLKLTEEAIQLYFGKGWRQSDYDLGSSFSESELREYDFSVLNATYLLRRTLKDAVLSGSDRLMQDALGLINYFVARLDKKCRFREICGFCVMIVPDLKKILRGWTTKVVFVNGAYLTLFKYACSLRMLGEFEESREIIEFLLTLNGLPDRKVASLKLQLCLILSDLDDEVGAHSYAKEVVALASKGPTLYHAEAILLYKSTSKASKAKLKSLQKKCEQESHFISSNNISIKSSIKYDEASERREIYNKIRKGALVQQDIYNYVKCTVRYVDLCLKGNVKIPKETQNALKSCYDYLVVQRLDKLFKLAHVSLWSLAEAKSDYAMMASLVLRGSRTFRLLNDAASEKKWILKFNSLGALNSNWFSVHDLRYLQGRLKAIDSPSRENGTAKHFLKENIANNFIG
ncbi:hypothetical protein KTT58_12230 [Pseudomonas viridiflava]|uniref:hypothetical protein n=1 Tax=Pseudomonas viridiflava TaxID=33069 RepID=UPI001C2DE71F|nr:hypothetical protein [Pseudomonas viridiflava]MBV1813507.1 hypothetical protein [Pseudomonas viridiflava]